ncbi:myristylated tegument protein CIRC-like protein [Phocid alphaherpesvirus 1]|uniref:Myristylated tegument protein CIRC-like protein n=1 Tax=Phocid alphaherpesvirus 1 TaxID=47418 RepID=A0A482F440_9ALPH|nr:myristylated tegument protein CIRC-like protein [Phocid alphaherpesvirus 1]QBN85176.1 myristylated tegument protein CIRC-like protein [Phocid alphaherpesvirus 1]UNP64223.1 myristylated tegument protein CIRC-like protein [Phocid alphaherpesvirus 1]
MGATTSTIKLQKLELLTKNTQILLDGIRGRVLDLPGGDELRIITDIYNSSYNNMVRTSSNYVYYLRFIGRAYTLSSDRKFYIYLSKNMAVLGYEPETGLHFLSKSLHFFLNEIGLGNRDLKIIDGKLLNSTYEPLSFPNHKSTMTRCSSSESIHSNTSNLCDEVINKPLLCKSKSTSDINKQGFCEHQCEYGSVIDLAPNHQPYACSQKCNTSKHLYRKNSESIKSVFF